MNQDHEQAHEQVKAIEKKLEEHFGTQRRTHESDAVSVGHTVRDQAEKREAMPIRQNGVKMPKGSKFKLAPITERERRPFANGGWREYAAPPAVAKDGPASAWRRKGLLVVSSFSKKVDAPDGSGEAIPQWMLSISVWDGTRRATDEEVRQTLVCFGMTEAEEDNHFPGIARMHFLVVDPARRVDCECKSDETTVVEPDGYRWQKKIEEPK